MQHARPKPTKPRQNLNPLSQPLHAKDTRLPQPEASLEIAEEKTDHDPEVLVIQIFLKRHLALLDRESPASSTV